MSFLFLLLSVFQAAPTTLPYSYLHLLKGHNDHMIACVCDLEYESGGSELNDFEKCSMVCAMGCGVIHWTLVALVESFCTAIAKPSQAILEQARAAQVQT